MSDFENALAAGTRELYADAELYEHEFRHRRKDLTWYRRLAKHIDSGSGGEGGIRILELGSGSGRLLLPLVRDGHTVWGIDRSLAMLRRCQARLRYLNAQARARVHILQGDFRELPLGDKLPGRFPLIICPFNSFMHLYTRQDVERCLGEVRRLLAEDGLFAFDIIHPDPAWLGRDPTKRFARTRVRHPKTGEPLLYSTSHIYDPATQIAWIQIYYEADPSRPGRRAALKSAPARVIRLTQRVFFPAEIDALLHYNGFEVVHHAGRFDGGSAQELDGALLSPVSAEQVICARMR